MADDVETNRLLLQFLLESQGAKVTCVNDGQEVLDITSTQNFDAIIVDIQMPIVDGYQAMQQLRSSDFDGVIIALTANAMKGDRQKCVEAGCTCYLSKPIDANKLYQALSDNVVEPEQTS